MSPARQRLETQHSDRPVRRTWQKALLGVAIAIFFLFGVEVVGHLVFLARYKVTLWESRSRECWLRYTPFGFQEHIPGRSIWFGEEYRTKQLEVDELGFVDNGGDDSDVGSTVILVTGGSTIEGQGASSNSQTIPAQLERILNRGMTGKRFRVLNGGVSDYVSYQQLCRLHDPALLRIKPDMIIAIDGRNDAFHTIAFADHGWQPNSKVYFDEFAETVNDMIVKGRVFAPKEFLLRYSTIAFAMCDLAGIGAARPDRCPQESMPGIDVLRSSVEAYLSNHILANAKCERMGVDYYAFLQPVLLSSLKELTTRDEEIMKGIGKHWKGDGGFYWIALQQWYELARFRGRHFGFYHDMSAAFSNAVPQVYFDSCHYTDEGNRMIAEAVAAIVAPGLSAKSERRRQGHDAEDEEILPNARRGHDAMSGILQGSDKDEE